MQHRSLLTGWSWSSVNSSAPLRATSTPPTASGGVGHVTPGELLQRYRAVTLGERECNQRPAAGERANTGVYVFTCVNASEMRQFRAQRRVRGYRAVTRGVQRGLTVPLRSSIVRAGVTNAEVLGELSGILSALSVDIALGDAIHAEHQGCTW